MAVDSIRRMQRRTNLCAGASATVAVLVAALAVGSARGEGVEGECLSRAEAESRVQDLRAQGSEAGIEAVPCRRPLHVVRVDGLADARAQRDAIRRLRAAGMEAAGEGARAVRVGAYTDEASAEERLYDLLALGFRSVGVIRTERPGEGFRVVADDPAGSGEPDEFTFGEPESDGTDSDEEPGSGWQDWTVRFDELRLHAGYLPRSGQPVKTYSDGTASVSVRWQPGGAWEARLGGRVDGRVQTARGGAAGDADTAWGELDYTENWVRYRADWGRMTVGTQTVPWGTMDLFPPSDRLSVLDLTAGPVEAIDEGRRASPSLRLENYGPVDVDLLLTPVFRPAELPRAGTLWHPIDQRRGRWLGVPDEPVVRELVRRGSFEHDARSADRDAVGGIRLSQAGRDADWALTLQSARQSVPYYALTDPAREAFAAGGPQAALNAPGDTFEARHPRSLIVGGDLALDAAGVTWRFEGAWSSDEPATREQDLEFVTRRGVDWAMGAEFFPGDANFRVSLQLTGEHLLDADDVLDPRDTVRFGGELEQPWARQRWHTRLRFQLGLDRNDVYINPEVAWSVTDNQELTLAGHYFRGADDTAGGFFEDHDMLRLAWEIHL